MAIKYSLLLQTMVMVFRKKYWIKYFNLFSLPNPQGREQGLGLSLSYDIVKAHGGRIDIRNQQGEGAEFIIKLPTIRKLINNSFYWNKNNLS